MMGCTNSVFFRRAPVTSFSSSDVSFFFPSSSIGVSSLAFGLMMFLMESKWKDISIPFLKFQQFSCFHRFPVETLHGVSKEADVIDYKVEHHSGRNLLNSQRFQQHSSYIPYYKNRLGGQSSPVDNRSFFSDHSPIPTGLVE